MIVFSLVLLLVLCCNVIRAEKAMITPQIDDRSPKRVGFGAIGGGSSHYLWVMEILQELVSRGHTTIMYTRKDCLRFAQGYPNIQTQTIGGDFNFLTNKGRKEVNPHFKHPKFNPAAGIDIILPALLTNYTSEFNEFKTIIKDKQMDVMICDMFSFACIDATTVSKIPLIITSTVAFSKDTTTGYVNNILPSYMIPTTETMTLWDRLVYFFYRVYLPFKASQLDHPTHEFQKQLGLPLSDGIYRTTQDAFKLVNNMYGIEIPRPFGPLAQLVGPILNHRYDALTPELSAFLDTHQRVIYVAFGQHAVPSDQDTQLLVQAIYTNLQVEHIDAVIWASASHHPAPEFPANNKNILVTGWSPQFAILQHPSVALFVTHGGAGSVFEALFNKVPLFVFPFFGDQPVTARMVQQQQLGEYIDTAGLVYNEATLEQVTRRMALCLTDPVIRQRVARFGAAVQIRSLHAVQRSADIVEEIAVAAIDGKVFYLEDAGRRISWIKRHNYDLVATVIGFFVALGWIGLKLVQLVKISRKIKTL